MNKDLFKSLEHYFASIYYLEILVIICQFLALLIGIAYYKRRREGLYFLIYIVSWLFVFTVATYIRLYISVIGHDTTFSILIDEIFVTIASIVEFCCFAYFFYKSLKSRRNKVVVKILAIAFTLPVMIFIDKLFTGSMALEIRHLSFLISSIGMCLLVIPCLLYYSELVSKKSYEPISQKPSFMIVSSFLLYCLLVIPFFLVADKFIETNPRVYHIGMIIHELSFCFLFVVMTWAFRLNKSLTA